MKVTQIFENLVSWLKIFNFFNFEEGLTFRENLKGRGNLWLLPRTLNLSQGLCVVFSGCTGSYLKRRKHLTV